MLVLARRIDEAVVINENITIRVLEVKGNQIKLGIEAPGEVTIHREEVYRRIVEENRRAAQEAPADLAGLDTVFRSDGPLGRKVGDRKAQQGEGRRKE